MLEPRMSTDKDRILSAISVRKLDSSTQENETGPISHTIHKREHKMDWKLAVKPGKKVHKSKHRWNTLQH